MSFCLRNIAKTRKDEGGLWLEDVSQNHKGNVMLNELTLFGRESSLFEGDVQALENQLSELISSSSFLIVGGAGTIGQATVKELVKRDARTIHVVDLSENNLVELVRDVRSMHVRFCGEFKTFSLDSLSREFEAFVAHHNDYDFILNFAALKHVRSERDPFTLSRLVDVNIFNSVNLARQAKKIGAKKYFCVSTDKAANPVNIMGASKRIMELFLYKDSEFQDISTARFANVAFSDGSLLYGFNERLRKRQPIAAPSDIKRFFMTRQEAGQMCMLSCLLGENRDTFFPKLQDGFDDITFPEIVKQLLLNIGYEPFECES